MAMLDLDRNTLGEVLGRRLLDMAENVKSNKGESNYAALSMPRSLSLR